MLPKQATSAGTSGANGPRPRPHAHAREHGYYPTTNAPTRDDYDCPRHPAAMPLKYTEVHDSNSRCDTQDHGCYLRDSIQSKRYTGTTTSTTCSATQTHLRKTIPPRTIQVSDAYQPHRTCPTSSPGAQDTMTPTGHHVAPSNRCA